jgi:protein-S-isoprenylcysteine O-methyltransferase Ste14
MSEFSEANVTNKHFKRRPTFESANAWYNWLLYDLLPDHKIIPFRYAINFQKALVGLLMLAAMKYYSNYSLTCWVYLGLHGTYGLCWLFKDLVFPDPSFGNLISLSSVVVIYIAVLGPYMLIPIAVASGYGPQEISGERCFVAVGLFTVGLMIMMVSDAQKYYVLKQKRGLITDGMMKYTRNPNYLGEIMLYCSFNVVARIPAVWYFFFCFDFPIVFMQRMLWKDYMLSRK